MFNNLKKFLGGIEVGQYAYIKNATVESVDSDPSAIISEGRIWFNKTKNAFKASFIDPNDNTKLINLTFHTKEEFDAFVAKLASLTEGEGSALVGFSGRTGAYEKFSLPAKDLESTLKAIVDAIDADRKAIEDNKVIAQDTINDVQEELDRTQVGAGLNDDGTYTAKSDANYIQNATSLYDADAILDQSLKNLADKEDADVAAINDRIDNLNQTLTSDFLNKKITDTQTVAGPVEFQQNIIIDGDLIVKGQTTEIETVELKVSDNIITLNNDIPEGSAPTENAGIEINRGAEGVMPFIIWDEAEDVAKVVVGKDADGNYILDKIATGGNADSIQEELDRTQVGAGLNDDGTYTSDSNANYIKEAKSLYEADQILDTQVKANADAIATETARAKIIETNLQTEIDNIEAGAGLNDDGTYTAPADRNYISDATSLYDADLKLDSAVKANADAIAAETARAEQAEADLQAELDETQLGAGLNDDGTYTADINANYISSAESLYNADQILDAAVKANKDALDKEIQDRIDGDNQIKTALDNSKLIFDATDAAASYTITHNFNTFNISVVVWLYDEANNVYYNDDVRITQIDVNNVQIDLSIEAKIKAIITNENKLFS